MAMNDGMAAKGSTRKKMETEREYWKAHDWRVTQLVEGCCRGIRPEHDHQRLNPFKGFDNLMTMCVVD
jgi:hypothetical protein